MTKVRESNFELMRIISMLFIVIYHMIISTGGKLINYTVGLDNLFLSFISLLIIVHVNSFVLITGYFQHNKKFNIKKVFSLVGMVYFYKVLIGAIAYFIFHYDYTYLDIIKILSPLDFGNLWFFGIYLALYLISPYLNRLIKNLTQKEHRRLIIMLLIMYSLITTLSVQSIFNNTGFTLVHFVMLYIIGAYLKKYPVSQNLHFMNYSNKKRFFIFLTIFLVAGTFNFLLYNFADQLVNMSSNEVILYIGNSIKNNCFYYQTPLVMIQSISYFLLFETFSFKSKIINRISQSIFAVYIITENVVVVDYLYKFLKIDIGREIYSHSIILRMFICSVIVLLVCVVIDMVKKFICFLLKKLVLIFKRHLQPS